jgi:S-DNA-T family DNA segregation ATPase FtsK/SpoIIIE
VWWSAGGPVGAAVKIGLTTVIGAASAPLPLVLLGIGIYLMSTPSRPEIRPRVVLGGLLLVFGGLGLIDVLCGAPVDLPGWRQAGGALGYVAGAPLTAGLTWRVAAPVLALVAVYGLLVLTGTPVREVPARLGVLFRGAPRPEADPSTTEAGGAEGHAADPTDPAALEGVRLRRPSGAARRQRRRRYIEALGGRRARGVRGRSTRRSPASPAARRSPATRSSSARRQGREDHRADQEHRLRRGQRQRPHPQPRSPASPRSASRSPTPTRRWSRSATCCARAPRATTTTRW